MSFSLTPFLLFESCILTYMHTIILFSQISSTARHLLAKEETEAIMKSAQDCVDEGCSVDAVSDLILDLQEQELALTERLEKVTKLIGDLQYINGKDERHTDEVQAFVKDMLRVFNHDKPIINPTGFTGEIGDGPKTAWDALPPKKWSPNKNLSP